MVKGLIILRVTDSASGFLLRSHRDFLQAEAIRHHKISGRDAVASVR